MPGSQAELAADQVELGALRVGERRRPGRVGASTRRSTPCARRAAARRSRSTGRSGARWRRGRVAGCAGGRASRASEAGRPRRRPDDAEPQRGADGPRAGRAAPTRDAGVRSRGRLPTPGEARRQVAVDVEVAGDVGLGQAELAGRATAGGAARARSRSTTTGAPAGPASLPSQARSRTGSSPPSSGRATAAASGRRRDRRVVGSRHVARCQHELRDVEVAGGEAGLAVRQVEVPHAPEGVVEAERVDLAGVAVEALPPQPQRVARSAAPKSRRSDDRSWVWPAAGRPRSPAPTGEPAGEDVLVDPGVLRRGWRACGRARMVMACRPIRPPGASSAVERARSRSASTPRRPPRSSRR